MNTNKVNQQDETSPLATAVHIAALASHGDAISHELEEAIFQYVAIVGSKQRLDIAFNKIAATEPTGVPDEVLETWKIESGFAVLDARTDEIYEQVKDLEVKICEMPCLSIGDIAAKVGFVTRYLQSEPDPDYEDKYVKALNSMAFLPEGHGAVASLFERVAKVATDDVPVAHHGSHAKSTRDDEAVSENIARFVEILEYFKSLLEETETKRAQLEPSKLPQFAGTEGAKAWEVWVQGTNYSSLCAAEDSIEQVINALEALVRSVDCQTIGDIRVKMKLVAQFASYPDEDAATHYAKESLDLVRSIAAMFPH
ncbi:hypothetical protein FB480_102154 [Agrobacterium vitis]|nr:hypothetical protein FB480_102154 [Agrobacterium vitis]